MGFSDRWRKGTLTTLSQRKDLLCEGKCFIEGVGGVFWGGEREVRAMEGCRGGVVLFG
jgi:hypothetical protein